MDYKKLSEMQKKLRKDIMDHHPEIKNDVERFDKLILALNVEVSEIANEVRCFKFWSLKPPSSKAIIIEEFVDALHFVLELGIELNEEIGSIYYLNSDIQTITEKFNELYECVSRLNRYRNTSTYQMLVSELFTLGMALGFTDEDIEAAYLKKNEINHNRQEEGY